MLRNIFDSNNRFWQALSKLADLMLLNLCFIISSLPIITIGASATSLYYVTLKMAENEEGYIARSFFKSFRQNFRQATVIWLLLLCGGSLLGMDFIITWNGTGFLGFMKYASMAVALIYLMILIYVFPLLARFDNTIIATIRNAFIFAVIYLPRTAAMIAIVVIPIIVTLYNMTTLGYMLLFWLMTGFSLIAYWNSKFLKNIFKKYME